MEHRNWTRDEFVLVLNLYYKLPFGRLNRNTKEVKELAELLGRSNNSIALRLVNFAACDPYIISSGRHGMSSGKKICQPYWDEFYNNQEELLFESEQILARLQGVSIEEKYEEKISDMADLKGESRIQEIKARVNQYVFRDMILSNYSCQCALTGIDVPELLVASHILPWSYNKQERLNPENGICLSMLYDAAFDKGLIGFDKNYRVVLSEQIRKNRNKEFYDKHFGCMEGVQLKMPEEHFPNKTFLEWHIDTVFRH